MSKEMMMTPRELGEKRKEAAAKREEIATNREMITQKVAEKKQEVPTEKAIIVEESSAKKVEVLTEKAIIVEEPSAKRVEVLTEKAIIVEESSAKKAEVPAEKAITVEEFSAKKAELAIKLITDSLETPNAKQLEKIVLEMSSIGLPKIVNFTSNFIIKYPDPIFQNQIFDIVLRKIEVSSSPEKLHTLKSEILLFKAKAIIAINSTEQRTQIKLENATEALKLLENANSIQNHYITALIKDTTKALITEHPNLLEAFGLAKYSVEFRKAHLDSEPNHPSILEAYITTAQVGHIIDERAIKIEAMQNADIAYNMALQLGNKAYAAAALKFLASIYKSFGDIQKTNLLLKQSTFLEHVVKKVDNSKEQEPLPLKSSHTFEIIRKHGISDDLTLTIKQKIQESVLNYVYTAATQSKWINKLASIEYGISGYLDEKFLGKALGNSLNTPENIDIALMLCFEAINIGIMSNPIKNPLCSVAFVQQYPKLVPTILNTHPEYFVDGHIFKATLLKASKYTRDLLGKEAVVNGSYNAYLETIMMPIIAHRLSSGVLEPVSNLIKAGKWDLSTQNQLLALASEEYLTGNGAIYTSTLGQNLSSLSDSLNISRILIFKKILDAIKESSSKNYAPVEIFAKSYADVIKRILADHPDYITNSHIIDICQQAFIVSLIPEVINHVQIKPEVPVLGEDEAELIDS